MGLIRNALDVDPSAPEVADDAGRIARRIGVDLVDGQHDPFRALAAVIGRLDRSLTPPHASRCQSRKATSAPHASQPPRPPPAPATIMQVFIISFDGDDW